ncbi:MAG: hypothetical protein ABW046_20425 [Actinoplanes sp.]
MTRKLAAVLLALTVLAAGGVLTETAPASIIGGLLLAFGLPGAALVAVLFRTRGTLNGVELFTLVPALSLATLVLGGMAAWAAGVSLNQDTWMVVSGSVTVVALVVALIRPALPAPAGEVAGDPRVQLPTAKNATMVLPVFLDREGRTEEQAPPTGSLMTRVILPFALVAVMIGGASWLSLNSSRSTHSDTVTALSAATPGVVSAAGTRVVRVTATGLPADSATYRVIVTNAAGTAGKARTVEADSEGTWTGDLTVPGAQRVTIGLYREGDTSPYRSLIIAAG